MRLLDSISETNVMQPNSSQIQSSLNLRQVMSTRKTHGGIAFLLCLLFAFAYVADSANADDLAAQFKSMSITEVATQSMKFGDAARGEVIFNHEKLGCAKCHTPSKDAAVPKPIGPSLDMIGDRLKPEQLAESIITPNKTITEGFQSYVVLTSDGEVVTGVLVSQSAKEVILAVPDKGQVRIPADDVEEMQKGKSAMPADVVNELGSKQAFFDLVAYLASRKASASASGTPVIAADKLIVKEVPVEGKPLPLLAIARPDGICYTYDPNTFRLDSIWQGPLGWQSKEGRLTLNQSSAELFHIRDMPWMSGVGKDGFKFDFKWLGHRIENDQIVMRYELKGQKNEHNGKVWTVEESLEIPSLLQQRLNFRIKNPSGITEGLTFWLRQTNYRNVATNGQQAQRNQLEFLKPGQTDFSVTLSRRRSGQTVPHGYSISRIEGPKPEEPFLFEPTGFSFAPDGTAFVSTRNGNIWRYHDQQWNLFADGLQETQGVRVAENGRDVYTMQKPELTLLVDSDSDGVADLYRSVANGFRYTGHYHEFAYGPVANSAGEMFFSTGLSSSGNHEAGKSGTGQMSSALGYRGWMMKVDTDGQLSPFACGFRSPAGIGINAQDELFITDNQGDWVASSYLGHVEADDFMGHPATLWDREAYGITPRVLDYKTVDARVADVPDLDEAKLRAQRKRPAVWLIHGDLTNSPGNPSFCPPKGFGPFAGQAFIADISHRAIVRVALEKVSGQYQGAAIPFIRPLASASFSTCFDPEGRLWVGSVGRGWTTGDPMIEVISLDNEETPFEMQQIELTRSGFDIHFTQPLADFQIAADQINIKRFHYLYWAEYGSDRQDNTSIDVQEVQISPDRQTISITIPLMKDKVYEIDLGRVQSQSGLELKNNFAFYTLNELLK